MRMRIESGTCNVCSAPCSSCMHYNRSMSVISSKNESGFSGVICVKGEEADSSSVINLPICKNRICDDLQHVASEASNLVSTTSSHDSYFENADSKAIFKTSTVYDASDNIEMPQDVSSREFVEEERQLKRKTGHDQVSSQSNVSAQLEYRDSSGQGEEQSDLECHGDNLLDASEVRDAEKKTMEYSNMIMDSSFKVNDKAVPNEGGGGNHDHVETHSIVGKLNGTEDVSLLDNIGNSISVNTVGSVKSQLPLPECGVSPEIIKHAQVDNVELSPGSLTPGSSKHNSSAFLIKSGFSSGKSKIDELCQGTRTVTDLEKPFDNGSKETHVNAPLERISSVLDATNGQGSHVPTQANTEGENSDLDVLLDDVKVCDICGDAGREDLLAVCSKCSDGAEHTYCMSEMLDKVPEGDWLCEECKIKEMKNQNVDGCEAVSGRLSSTCLNESSKNALSSSVSMKSPKLDSGPTDLVTPGPFKPPQSSHILSRRQADLPEEGKASERNVALTETASPRKKSILSRQFSLKSQKMENVKTTSIPTLSEVQSVKGSEAFSRSKASLSSASFKGQPQPHSSHGPLSRSVSFSYSNSVPKVRTLVENASHKQNITKASMASDLRKDGLGKSLARTTSFNITTSGRASTDLLSKSSSFKPSLTEGLRGPKEVKERNNVERKNTFAMQNSFVRPSSVVASSNYPIKMDAKYVHSDGKIKGVSETDVARSSRGVNDANDLGFNEGKKQASCSSKIVGFFEGNAKVEHPKKSKLRSKDVQTSTSSIDGSKRKVEILSPHGVQSSDSGRKDESMRDSSSSTNSRLSSQGGSQKLRCQKCNETGHVAQHCSIDKLKKSANKLSAVGNSNEVVKKPNKWREIVDAAKSRNGMLKGNQPDACGELPVSKADANCEAASKFAPSVSVVESGNGKGVIKDLNVDSTKNLTVTNSEQPAVVPVEVSYVYKADDSTAKFSEKPFSETLQELSPLVANALKASAVPKLESIWHGSFNVVGSGKCPEMFDGIQAHLSSCASHRVFEAAIKIPAIFHLEEASHISLWPSHFQKFGPQEENIGLFFFAEDSESYERSYRKLMDRMHKNDLALRGNIDGIELLIFTSNKLPMKSQRWNMMHYLWGMFRTRRGCGLPAMGGHKRASIANFDMDLPSQDSSIPLPPIADIHNAQNSEKSSILNKLSDEGRPSKMMRRDLADPVDMPPIASGIEDKVCRRLEASIQNSLMQVVADPNVARGQPSFPVGNSSGTIADTQRAADSSKSMLLLPASKSRSEEKNDETFQKKIVSDCTNRKTGDLGEESNVIGASFIPPNCNQGDEFSRIEGNLRDKECSTSSAAIIDDDDPRQNVLVTDCLNNRKRRRSCSIEAHGMPNNTAEIGQSWMSIDDERELKKTCYASDCSGTEVNASTRFSSKIHPLYSTILSEQIEGEGEDLIYGQPAMLEKSKIMERCFFPTDLLPVQNNKSAHIIHIPSSDDEEAPEACTPDLELALGGKSKLAKPAASPPFPLTSFGGKHLKVGSLGDEGDDLSASLSLSIGFPTAERERSAMNFLKREQASPEKPSTDTSLFLFGKFSNS